MLCVGEALGRGYATLLLSYLRMLCVGEALGRGYATLLLSCRRELLRRLNNRVSFRGLRVAERCLDLEDRSDCREKQSQLLTVCVPMVPTSSMAGKDEL